MGSLNSVFTALIAEFCRKLIIAVYDGRIFKVGQFFSYNSVFVQIAITGEDFLSNGSNDDGSLIPNKSGKRLDFGLISFVPGT
jgi:hypothetical protein